MSKPSNATGLPRSQREQAYFTSKEAARYLGYASNVTLARLRNRGEGPKYSKLGPGPNASVRYTKADLDAWASKRTFSSTSQYGQGGDQ